MTEYTIGFAQAEITAWEPDISMLGWGMPFNRVEDVAAPLMARAMVVTGAPADDGAPGRSIAYVCCDLLFVSELVREVVLERLAERVPELGLDHAAVALTATHTHSGPGGFSSYFWKSLGGPGFSRPVFDTIVDGIVASIVEAAAARAPGRLFVVSGEVPAVEGIAFNRSWHAYNQNHDVTPVTRDTRDTALDRTMTVLRAEDSDGQPLGALVWFALHGTCVHADNRLMHPDHKGIAAELARSGDGAPPVVIMAQEAAGDVSPNHRYDPTRGCNVGRYDDDFASAHFVASVEARFARQLFDAAREQGSALAGAVDAAVIHRDFGQVEVAAEIDPRAAGRSTRRPIMGIGMPRGTAEGPGPLGPVPWFPKLLNRAVGAFDRLQSTLPGRERKHDPLFPLIDFDRGTRGRLLGFIPLSHRTLPPVEQIVRYVRGVIRDGHIGRDEHLMPSRMPFQLLRIGGLAIATTPFEVTTVSGRRLRSTLERALATAGVAVDHVVINPYANGYTGYMTTFEEYQVQAYEGSYTLFGPYSLGGLRTVFADVAAELGRAPAKRRSGAPPRHLDLDLDYLARRPFAARWEGEEMRYVGGYRE